MLVAVWRTQSHSVAAIVSTGLFVGAFQYATPLTFGALGGLFSERSGVVNIGLEGMMLMGCFWGVVVSQESGSWEIGLLGAMAAGGFLGLIHAVLSIHLRANQVISGTAVNILGLGITSYGTNAIFGSGGSGDVPRIPSVLHFLTSVPLIGDVIGGLNLMIYVALALVFASWFFLFRTAWGLRLRAVGEHPRAADTVGIPVFAIRYAAVTFSGVLAGMGGAYLAFGLGSQFSENMTAGRGFIALAALIFGNWRPFGLLFAALLFGFSQALGDALQTIEHVNAFLVFNLPYVFTLIALVGVIGRSRAPGRGRAAVRAAVAHDRRERAFAAAGVRASAKARSTCSCCPRRTCGPRSTDARCSTRSPTASRRSNEGRCAGSRSKSFDIYRMTMYSPRMNESTYFTLASLLDGPLHGYGIVKRAGELSGGRVKIAAGTLYGVLDRLRAQGLVADEGQEIVDGRARRSYRLTAAGEVALAGEAARLRAAARVVHARRPAVKYEAGVTPAERAYRLALLAYPRPTGASAGWRS